ncbi:MAG: Holliday junction branch migration protein RuvA [Acidobacteria bacterium]|nr:Holliday junction branch migration protein RuvA [Acidobacteriota bacterium]
MIAQITGKLSLKNPNCIIVDVGGVGYELNVPLSTFYDLGEIGSETSLRVYTHVREDTLQLFGFRTESEKKLFLLLMTVSGIGPKLAITVLSGLSTEELIQAIRLNDLARLVSIPGVGKKTAERMVVELKDKVATIAPPGLEERSARVGSTGSGDSFREDLISALINLGYSKALVEKSVLALLRETPDMSFETALKKSLRMLSK